MKKNTRLTEAYMESYHQHMKSMAASKRINNYFKVAIIIGSLYSLIAYPTIALLKVI